jgi:hypothetical protein
MGTCCGLDRTHRSHAIGGNRRAVLLRTTYVEFEGTLWSVKQYNDGDREEIEVQCHYFASKCANMSCDLLTNVSVIVVRAAAVIAVCNVVGTNPSEVLKTISSLHPLYSDIRRGTRELTIIRRFSTKICSCPWSAGLINEYLDAPSQG